MRKNELKIYLASPRGFCAGVDRAIEIVKKSIDKFGSPVYVRHEIVHNKHVVESLKKIGAIFVEEISEIKDKSRPVIFSAHGVPKKVPKEAEELNMKYVDATCPLVSKVHREAENMHKNGYHIILIGHKGHPEVIGTLGRHPEDSDTNIYLVENYQDIKELDINSKEIAYVTQTTLSVDDTRDLIKALQEKFPTIIGPSADDICYATQNRQDAVKQLSLECEIVLVIGSKTSSNSNRLKELAEKCGTKSFLIDGKSDIDVELLRKASTVGITAGASAPEEIVQDVISFLYPLGYQSVRNLSENNESMTFKLPKELLD